jgi:hypothetical protein
MLSVPLYPPFEIRQYFLYLIVQISEKGFAVLRSCLSFPPPARGVGISASVGWAVCLSEGVWRCLEWDRLNIAPRFFYPVYSAHLLKIMETVIIVILMLLLLL